MKCFKITWFFFCNLLYQIILEFIFGSNHWNSNLYYNGFLYKCIRLSVDSYVSQILIMNDRVDLFQDLHNYRKLLLVNTMSVSLYFEPCWQLGKYFDGIIGRRLQVDNAIPCPFIFLCFLNPLVEVDDSYIHESSLLPEGFCWNWNTDCVEIIEIERFEI